jgi:hypothetical protein
MGDFAAEVLSYDLMAKADAEYGQSVFEMTYGGKRDAGRIRSAGTG